MSEPLTQPKDPKVPTRQLLAKFLPDHEAVRFFERLFQVAGDLTPTDIAAIYTILEDIEINAGVADSKAVEALDKSNKNQIKSKSNEVLIWLSTP